MRANSAARPLIMVRFFGKSSRSNARRGQVGDLPDGLTSMLTSLTTSLMASTILLRMLPSASLASNMVLEKFCVLVNFD